MALLSSVYELYAFKSLIFFSFFLGWIEADSEVDFERSTNPFSLVIDTAKSHLFKSKTKILNAR